MRREDIEKAVSIERELKSIERLLRIGSFDGVNTKEITDAICNIDYAKIRPLLEEKREELKKQIEEL